MKRVRYASATLWRKEYNKPPTKIFTWVNDYLDEVIEEADRMANDDIENNANQTMPNYNGGSYYLDFEFDIIDDKKEDWLIKTIHHIENAENINDLWNFPMADFNKKIITRVLKKEIKLWEKIYEKNPN